MYGEMESSDRKLWAFLVTGIAKPRISREGLVHPCAIDKQKQEWRFSWSETVFLVCTLALAIQYIHRCSAGSSNARNVDGLTIWYKRKYLQSNMSPSIPGTRPHALSIASSNC